MTEVTETQKLDSASWQIALCRSASSLCLWSSWIGDQWYIMWLIVINGTSWYIYTATKWIPFEPAWYDSNTFTIDPRYVDFWFCCVGTWECRCLSCCHWRASSRNLNSSFRCQQWPTTNWGLLTPILSEICEMDSAQMCHGQNMVTYISYMRYGHPTIM